MCVCVCVCGKGGAAEEGTSTCSIQGSLLYSAVFADHSADRSWPIQVSCYKKQVDPVRLLPDLFKALVVLL